MAGLRGRGLRARIGIMAAAIAVASGTLAVPPPVAAIEPSPIHQGLTLDGVMYVLEIRQRHHLNSATGQWEVWDMGSWSYIRPLGSVIFNDLWVANAGPGAARQIVSGRYGYPTTTMTTVWKGMNSDGSLSAPDAFAVHVTEVRPNSIVAAPTVCGTTTLHLLQNGAAFALGIIPWGSTAVTVLMTILGIAIGNLQVPPQCSDMPALELPARFDAYGNLIVDYKGMEFDEYGHREYLNGGDPEYFTTDFHYRYFIGSPDKKLPPPPVVRYSGSDRFSTAVDVSRHTFGPRPSMTYLVNAFNFPDALSAAAAAGTAPGPLLLTDVSSLNQDTATELTRLHPSAVAVVGSSAVVSDSIYNSLFNYTDGMLRYAGSDRFQTAVAVSRNTFPAGARWAYVANGFNFPDGLAGAAAAGTNHGPLLLTDSATLNPDTARELDRLNPSIIVVLGSSAVVSDAVYNSLWQYGDRVVRYGGSDRFATAAAVSANTFAPGVPVAYVAYGFNFPDALAGAAAAGTVHGPLLLADTNLPIPAATASELARLRPKQIVVLGSAAVISDAVKDALGSYAVP